MHTEHQCDLVVLGGGGSGLVAAVRAASLSGKKVIVLEKAKRTGGGALFASTMRTFQSQWQKDRNLPDQTDVFLRRVMDETYWKLDPKLVSNCIKGTGQFFDWLCELVPGIGDQFRVGTYVFDGPNGQQGPQNGGQNNGGGRLVMETMLAKCAELGVEVLTQHRAVDVEVQDGRITAVLAESPDGPVRVACKACVLATGSWICNKAVVEQVCPAFNRAEVERNPHSNPNYTGDGLPLAEKVGARLDRENFCLRVMGPMYNSKSMVLNGVAASDYAISVNLNGKRFVSEPMVPRMDPFDTGHVLLQQPRALSYAVFDANTMAAAIDAARNAPPMPGPFGPPHYPEDEDGLRSDIAKAVDAHDGYAFQADTPEELARQLGIDPEAFAETVRSYNEGCANGFDWDHFKPAHTLVPLNKGPYYAVKGLLSTDGAFGGVLVNPDMQAYRAEGGLVEGLYVTGDFASGRFISLGGVKRQVLNDISWAFSSGFLAGTSAAGYLNTL